MEHPELNKTDNINPQLISALIIFLDATPPLRLKKHLRRMLLDYITREKDCLPVDFDLYLADFANLFEFSDALSDNTKVK